MSELANSIRQMRDLAKAWKIGAPHQQPMGAHLDAVCDAAWAPLMMISPDGDIENISVRSLMDAAREKYGLPSLTDEHWAAIEAMAGSTRVVDDAVIYRSQRWESMHNEKSSDEGASS